MPEIANVNDRTNDIEGIIRSTTISSVTNFAQNRLRRREGTFQILDLLIPRERKIRSIVGGMETSLGKTLWEPLAKSLARANGFEVINEDLLSPAIMPAVLQNTIAIITESRLNRVAEYTAAICHTQIRNACQSFITNPIANFSKAPRGFGVDIWLRKDEVNYFFDTKTVQSNIGNFTKYFNQVINWYVYYYSRYPNGNAQARIVFPYNPYPGDYWHGAIGGGFPLEAHNEAWVEDEFWDFCSGIENTFDHIKATFENIAESGDLQEQIDRLFE
jgi:hypothetical protein